MIQYIPFQHGEKKASQADASHRNIGGYTEENTKSPPKLALGLAFWNRVLVITLLYGGFVTLAVLVIGPRFDLVAVIDQFDNWDLFTLVLAGGTLGLHLARKQFLAHREWLPALRFAMLLCLLLAASIALTGPTELALLCVLLAGIHLLLGVLA